MLFFFFSVLAHAVRGHRNMQAESTESSANASLIVINNIFLNVKKTTTTWVTANDLTLIILHGY